MFYKLSPGGFILTERNLYSNAANKCLFVQYCNLGILFGFSYKIGKENGILRAVPMKLSKVPVLFNFLYCTFSFQFPNHFAIWKTFHLVLLSPFVWSFFLLSCFFSIIMRTEILTIAIKKMALLVSFLHLHLNTTNKFITCLIQHFKNVLKYRYVSDS